MATRRPIHCIECEGDVLARLTDGKEVYPQRPDLADLPFWICPSCSNFVGCHHKTDNRTAPLGVIANAEVKHIRIKIHNILDTLWKEGTHTRAEIYRMMSERCGWHYHTGKIRSLVEAKNCLSIATNISKELTESID